ncbi:hypothetical protein OG949_07585 [Streptomyces scopuliridis]|uniref:hypothetical protein n=1 Tax=Streptomyces scopuliridis TaxID=452529 RepID=UPI002DDB3C49|nr:hypothetical protein [Streptomyces scopuliridis]WSB32733.1 hypothetical protein OG949_07585 [Streptomyces scopuliridis]
MFDQMRQRRAAARLKPGDGRELRSFRWWQLFSRALFHLRLLDAGGRPIHYAIDIKRGGEQEDTRVRAHLFLNGRHHAESRVPAYFPVEGGHIEVAVSASGIRRLHFVTVSGAEQQLVPDPRSAEGLRARFDREHPALSRCIGFVSVVMLVVGVSLTLLQLFEPILQVPPIREVIGTYESPIALALWLNIALGLGAALGSTERALRLRYSWFLDGMGS